MSFWDSYETLSKWSSILYWIGISAALIAFIFGIIAYVFTNRATSLKDKMTQERIGTAESQATRLGDQMQPRTLTPEQKQDLLRELTSVADGSIEIRAAMGDVEAVNLANEFKTIFEASGWQTRIAQTTFARPQQGVLLVVHNKETAPPYSGRVQRIIGSLGFEVVGVENPAYSPNTLTLIVGTKPSP
ncbi:SUR7/PalI family protein [Acidobacteria bacterium AH-259-A15]|nr:SUR7/PalI family protein [Acidobacteria bacterium AH-259-A15]